MQHKQALTRLRALLRRDTPDLDNDSFAGPTLLQQEPDLAQEASRQSVARSAWAASGHSTD